MHMKLNHDSTNADEDYNINTITMILKLKTLTLNIITNQQVD
jgi:hypothetical protein